MKSLFICFVVFALIIMYVYVHKKRDDVWTKYGIQPFVLEDMDYWMKALNIYRETYEQVEDVTDKVMVRVNLEEARKEMFDLYRERGEQLGLDPHMATEFGRDMIKYNKI